MEDSWRWITAVVVGFLFFVALLIFGIGWANNLGDGNQVQITEICIAHPSAQVCRNQAYSNHVTICKTLADDAASTAGEYDQAFSAINWQNIYERCITHG